MKEETPKRKCPNRRCKNYKVIKDHDSTEDEEDLGSEDSTEDEYSSDDEEYSDEPSPKSSKFNIIFTIGGHDTDDTKFTGFWTRFI